MASAAFAVPLPVLVVNDRDGVQHRGTLQLPRRAPAAAPGRPSSADLARLRPLMRALGDALAAQEEGLDPERLSRTYTALMAELQEVAGMGVHAVHDVLDASQKPSLVGDKAPTDAASSACDTSIRGQDIERALAMCDNDSADVALQPCKTDRRTSIGLWDRNSTAMPKTSLNRDSAMLTQPSATTSANYPSAWTCDR